MLYVVGTPIGNLNDITLRALEALKSADVIAAEDTRHSGNLLRHFEIRKPLVSYHEHNEAMRTAELAERLAAGETVALITDAGMPGVSDPGARLIRACIERGLRLHDRARRLGGVDCAGRLRLLARAVFLLRLPAAEKRRARTRAASRGRARRDVGLFRVALPHQQDTAACAEIMPERQLCVARELTKKFEEFRRGTGAELLAHYEARPAKGEITFLVAGASELTSFPLVRRGRVV